MRRNPFAHRGDRTQGKRPGGVSAGLEVPECHRVHYQVDHDPRAHGQASSWLANSGRNRDSELVGRQQDPPGWTGAYIIWLAAVAPEVYPSSSLIYQHDYWCLHWYDSGMGATRKITIEVPAELLRRARRSTGEGITATVRRGLELVAARSAYEDLRRLRGTVSLAIDLEALRQDRR